MTSHRRFISSVIAESTRPGIRLPWAQRRAAHPADATADATAEAPADAPAEASTDALAASLAPLTAKVLSALAHARFS